MKKGKGTCSLRISSNYREGVKTDLFVQVSPEEGVSEEGYQTLNLEKTKGCVNRAHVNIF